MTFKQSPMYTPGGITPIGFIIHGTMGNYAGAVDWLTTNRAVNPSSAHYVVGKNEGDVAQLVKETDTAWHAGKVDMPTPRAQSLLPKNLLGAYKNPNASFIGIECEYLQPGDTLTEYQYKTIVEIIKGSGIKNPIIMCHKELTHYKGDFQNLDGSIDFSITNEIMSRLSPPAVNVKAQLQQKVGELTNLINQI